MQSVQTSEADVTLFMFEVAKKHLNTKDSYVRVEKNYKLVGDLNKLLIASHGLNWGKIDALDKMIAAKMIKFAIEGYWRERRPFHSRLWWRVLLTRDGQPFLKTLEAATLADLEETGQRLQTHPYSISKYLWGLSFIRLSDDILVLLKEVMSIRRTLERSRRRDAIAAAGRNLGPR
jgi:ribosome biogenesis protein Tsr3